MQKANIVIVGGGTAGIISGLSLVDNFNVTIIDSSIEPGGLLRSQMINGIEFDYGTHFIMETMDEKIDNMLFDMIDDSWAKLPYQKAGNYFNGKLNEDCPSMDLRTLSSRDYEKALVELFEKKNSIKFSNLEEQLLNTFGKTITKKIFYPILKKYYGLDLSQLSLNSHSLASSRVVILDPEQSRELKKNSKFDNLISYHSYKERISNARSFYPKQRGIGLWIKTLYEKFEKRGGKIIKGVNIDSAEISDRTINNIELNDNQNIPCDFIFCSISPAIIFNITRTPFPKNVTKPLVVDAALIHMEFDEKFLTDLYYLNCFDPDMLSFRVTLYSNFRESLFDTKKQYLTVECFLNNRNINEEDVIKIVVSELKKMKIINKDANYVFAKLIRLTNGFPIPSIKMKKSSSKLLSEAKTKFKNVSFVGRGSGESFYLQDIIRNSFYEAQNLKENLV